MATELPTPAELAALAQQKLRAVLDPTGTGAVDLAAGSRNDNMVSVNTALCTRVAQYAADRLTARSLATATGDDLDALVADIYQDRRKVANAATDFVWLQRTGTTQTVVPVGSTFAVPATTTQQGVSFTTTQDTPVAASAGVASPISVPVQCTQTDVVGNVQTSLITQIVGALPDTTWVVAGVPAGAQQFAAGGTPLESDAQFRARIQQSAFDDSKKRGTKAAILAGALQAPGVSNVTVVEPGDGTILVFCGDGSYNLSSAMQTAVQTNLENWRAFGIPALVRPYTTIIVNILVTLYMQRGLQNYSTTGLAAQALANVTTYFANRQRPDEFFGPMIAAAVEAASAESQVAIFSSLTVASGPSPDGTFSVRRVADALYGSVQQMVRYVLAPGSVQINLAPPLTQ